VSPLRLDFAPKSSSGKHIFSPHCFQVLLLNPLMVMLRLRVVFGKVNLSFQLNPLGKKRGAKRKRGTAASTATDAEG
jgi:hypothetical protein